MRIKRIYILLLLSAVLNGLAQKNGSKREVKKLLKEANFELSEENYYASWRLYKQVLARDITNEKAGLNAVVSMFRLNYPADSAFPFVSNLKSNKQRGAKFYLAKIKHQQREFDDAINLLNDYQRDKGRVHSDEEIKYILTSCQNAKTFMSAPKQSIIKNMGENINSPFPDYVPVIAPDESALYFTSKRENSVHTKKNGDNTYFEDVYVSYNENGVWKKAENVGFPINSETNDGCVAISPDGQRMIVFRTAADIVTGDLYLTRLGKNNRWEELQLMTSEINSENIETSACFSNDTSEIYFSSDRPGGLGGKDIYRIKKLPNGKWGAPFNLGPNVNTKYDEDAPFLHPDGVTLYYSSKGHNTMGEYDVFKSVFNNQSNEFSESENLGYPINDVGNDIFFVLSVDGQRGFYSSVKKETFGGMDLYQIDTRFGENDLKVWHGVSFLGDAPGRVKITLVEKATNQLNGTYFSNPDNGKFIIVVNPLKNYKVFLEADDFPDQEIELLPMAVQNEKQLKIKLNKNSGR